VPSTTLALSPDLSCGVYLVYQKMTADSPEAPINAGAGNLYRRGADGSWEIITNLEPSQVSSSPAAEGYQVVGMSPDCNRVIFRTEFQYPSLPGVGTQRLYEWNEGTLGILGMIPGSGAGVVETIPGPGEGSGGALGATPIVETSNVVSDDAKRVFFTAISKVGGDIGKQAVFLRDDSGVATDVSQSKTPTANNDDSVYQTAARDGSSVLFLGRYGLAPNRLASGATSCAVSGSAGATGPGCDLYRYDVLDGSLTDLSPDPDGAGASVIGVLGASDDAKSVYFAARGQLVPGEGPSEKTNLTKGTFSVYLSQDETPEPTLEYVGRIASADVQAALVFGNRRFGLWSSRVTPSGSHLLFESRANVVDSPGWSGSREAYLYDAESDSVACVSCRRDGVASVASNFKILSDLEDVAAPLDPARSLSTGGSRVFFMSKNRLASGATAERRNFYQWEDGQISFIADSAPTSAKELQFAGSSESGNDVYFTTVDQLAWNDTDGQLDIYDARVGGGFAEPPAPSATCDPLSESSCLGSPNGGGGAIPPPASSGFAGPGNETPKSKKAGKKKKKGKKGKKGKSKGKGKGAKKSRNASKNGGSSK